jgi:hypothetical protein
MLAHRFASVCCPFLYVLVSFQLDRRAQLGSAPAAGRAVCWMFCCTTQLQGVLGHTGLLCLSIQLPRALGAGLCAAVSSISHQFGLDKLVTAATQLLLLLRRLVVQSASSSCVGVQGCMSVWCLLMMMLAC